MVFTETIQITNVPIIIAGFAFYAAEMTITTKADQKTRQVQSNIISFVTPDSSLIAEDIARDNSGVPVTYFKHGVNGPKTAGEFLITKVGVFRQGAEVELVERIPIQPNTKKGLRKWEFFRGRCVFVLPDQYLITTDSKGYAVPARGVRTYPGDRRTPTTLKAWGILGYK